MPRVRPLPSGGRWLLFCARCRGDSKVHVCWAHLHCSNRREATGLFVATLRQGGVCRTGGPEMRTFGGGLPRRFIEKTSSFTASFRGSYKVSVDSSTSSSDGGFWDGVTSTCWESSCPQTQEVRNQPRGALGPSTGAQTVETDQGATRSPLVCSWSSMVFAHLAQIHSDHAGVCPSPGLAM